MFDEPENGQIALTGVNDLPRNAAVTYTVTKLSGTPDTSKTVLSGRALVAADSAQKIACIPIADGEKAFYLIEWECNGQRWAL